MSKWDELKSEMFKLTTPPRSVTWLAEQIPVARSTVYHWLRGDTEKPTRVVIARVEQVVNEHKNKP